MMIHPYTAGCVYGAVDVHRVPHLGGPEEANSHCEDRRREEVRVKLLSIAVYLERVERIRYFSQKHPK